MSNVILPTLPGLTWPIGRRPKWKTFIQESASGKETRIGRWTYPRREYSLTYEVLRSLSLTEQQQLEGFYNARQGSFDDWLYLDPYDNATAGAQQFALGDGVTTQFALCRALGAAVEPVRGLPTVTSMTISDWQGSGTLTTTPRSNYLPNSEAINLWGFGGTTTVAANTVTAPNGIAFSGDTLGLPAVGDGNGQTASGGVPAVGSVWTFSIWLFGPVNGSTVNIQVQNNIYTTATVCTLSSGVWTRFSATVTVGASPSGSVNCYITRTGATTATTVYCWGAMLEQGSSPTRYIPNTATSVGPVVTQSDYSLSPDGIVTLPAPLSIGATVSWQGTYYWRCRFVDDEIDFSMFMNGLSDLKSLKFITLK